MNKALLTLTVKEKRRQAHGVFAFEFVDPFGGDLPAFTAGAHIDLHIRSGLLRQYSLCNNPRERNRYVIGVLREERSRGGSIALHEELKEGDFITASAPRNNFSLVPHARKSILFAGGIGITPILSMAEHLAAGGADFELHYCCRTRERAAFLDRIAASPFAHRTSLYFDDVDASMFSAGQILGTPDPETHAYVCGPQGYISAVLDAGTAQGWAKTNLHSELFAAPARMEGLDDTAFTVRLRSTGKTIVVPPGLSVTAALAGQGVSIPVSCEQGICGTCLTNVVEGTPLHRDQYLSDQEKARNNCFLPCCSRAKSTELVLDL